MAHCHSAWCRRPDQLLRSGKRFGRPGGIEPGVWDVQPDVRVRGFSSAYSWTYAVSSYHGESCSSLRCATHRLPQCPGLVVCFVCGRGRHECRGLRRKQAPARHRGTPTFPASAKATGAWFPRQERSLATAMFDGASKFASAIGVPLIGIVLIKLGWRMSFAVTGLISFLYFVAFYLVYREPKDDPKLSVEEWSYIERVARNSTNSPGAKKTPRWDS